MASISSKLLKHFGLKKGPPHPPNKDYGAQKSTSVQELLPRSPTIDRSTLSLTTAPTNACEFDTISLTESPNHTSSEATLQFGVLSTLPADINRGARPKETCKNTSPKDGYHTLPTDALSKSLSTNIDLIENIEKSSSDTDETTDKLKEFDDQSCTPVAPTPPQLLDEYSDPFDLKKQIAETPELLGAFSAAPVNDDDYSVPYEVKKLIQELKMQDMEAGYIEQKKPSSREETPNHLTSQVNVAADSFDYRPTEEYDEPWEWSINQNLILQQMDMSLAKSIPHMTHKRSNSSNDELGEKLIISSMDSFDGKANNSGDLEESSSTSFHDNLTISVVENEDDDGYTHLKDDLNMIKSDHEPELDNSSSLLNTSNTVIHDPHSKEVYSVGNYEEPWDLSSTQKELEEKLRAASISLDKNVVISSCVGKIAPHESDTRPQEGYEKPWDWKPHRKDDRPQEGYEKPWDWRPHQKDDRPTTEYEEPWDQKVNDIEVDLIHAKSAKEAALAAVIDEEFSSANGILGSCLGKKLDDTRPMDEYDEPWDQKIKKMGLTRSGSDSSGHSPVFSAHACDVTSPKKCKQDLSSMPMVGERVNPHIPLDEQGWYHGSISRHDAEHLLRVHKEGSYLVRLSESNKRDYSLSLKSARGFMHMKITSRDGRYILGQFSQPFDSIPLMINHYSASKLPIKGQEHMSLLHPVIHELL